MKTKVLVVDDSAFMRRVIADLINKDSTLEVIDTARNGEEALEKIKTTQPDVVTLDVEMPVMDGFGALEKIMKESPVPVLMVSGVTKKGADATIRALELGAVDFIAKPSNIFKVNTKDMADALHEKIKIAARVYISGSKKKSSLKKTTTAKMPVRKSKKIEKSPTGENKLKKIVAIGTSTGGPRALQSVIPALPADLEAAVVIVQHMPPGFTKSLAERMDTMSGLHVKEAEDGESLKGGWVYVAPGDKHMRVVKKRIGYQISLGTDAPVTGHKPSADALFYSLADIDSEDIIGVIMTGMGTDGAEGLATMKKMNKAQIIAQDEESCVVFGMPKATVAKGVVDRVVPLGKISDEILKAMGV